MPSNIYNENITTLYTKLVTIECGADKLYLNDSGAEVIFGGNTYMPVAFKIGEPNKASIEEGNATLNIIGVTNDYIEMIQNAEGTVIITSAVIANGDYALNPCEYTAESISINSSDASISVNIKTGGALGYFASAKSYSVTNFPGLSG